MDQETGSLSSGLMHQSAHQHKDSSICSTSDYQNKLVIFLLRSLRQVLFHISACRQNDEKTFNLCIICSAVLRVKVGQNNPEVFLKGEIQEGVGGRAVRFEGEGCSMRSEI